MLTDPDRRVNRSSSELQPDEHGAGGGNRNMRLVQRNSLTTMTLNPKRHTLPNNAASDDRTNTWVSSGCRPSTGWLNSATFSSLPHIKPSTSSATKCGIIGVPPHSLDGAQKSLAAHFKLNPMNQGQGVAVESYQMTGCPAVREISKPSLCRRRTPRNQDPWSNETIPSLTALSFMRRRRQCFSQRSESTSSLAKEIAGNSQAIFFTIFVFKMEVRSRGGYGENEISFKIC